MQIVLVQSMQHINLEAIDTKLFMTDTTRRNSSTFWSFGSSKAVVRLQKYHALEIPVICI